MRFFKYLFLIFILIPSFSYAEWKSLTNVAGREWSANTPSKVCSDLKAHIQQNQPIYSFTYSLTRIDDQNYQCNITAPVAGTYSYQIRGFTSCPSATKVDLKVPLNAQTYQCVDACQYRLRACVDVDFEPGQTCTAISTGIECGQAPPSQSPAPGTTTPDSTGTPAAPGQNSSNTNTNSATTTGTSTSTSTSTTTNNTTTNTSTTNTTTTTNINTTTKIDLSSLESAIESIGKLLGGKLDAIKEALGGDSGGDTGTPDGNGTDLTETNSKLDDIKKNGDKLNNWLQGKNEDGTGGGVGDNPFGTDTTPERVLDEKTFQTNIFSGSASCPADRTLSMTLFTGKTFSTTFSYSIWCEKLSVFGYFILIASYLYGALIIVRNS